MVENYKVYRRHHRNATERVTRCLYTQFSKKEVVLVRCHKIARRRYQRFSVGIERFMRPTDRDAAYAYHFAEDEWFIQFSRFSWTIRLEFILNHSSKMLCVCVCHKIGSTMWQWQNISNLLGHHYWRHNAQKRWNSKSNSSQMSWLLQSFLMLRLDKIVKPFKN